MDEQSVFTGKHIQCLIGNDDIAELWLNHGSASVNKFDQEMLKDLREAVTALSGRKKDIRGLMIGSRKEAFVVGADITEFMGYFSSGEDNLKKWLNETHRLFSEIEDFSFPTITAINGLCLGGGMELALTTSFRIASDKASLGLPETRLGIYPGWGGTIRFPRLVGCDNAIEWIAGGGTYKSSDALKTGAVDAVVSPEDLYQSCHETLLRAAAGELDWQSRRKDKISPLKFVSPLESAMAFESAKAYVMAKAGKHYPAPLEAISRIQKAAGMVREEASPVEIEGFIKMALTPVAHNLISVFLSDQFNKKQSKKTATGGKEIRKVAVIGAGIMGGGIAYQSASKHIPSVMKDISNDALNAGMKEASRLLNGQVERGKITVLKMAESLNAMSATLNYSEFSEVPLVIEAVVENEKIKKSVYQDLEGILPEDAVIASNTSTISITRLARELKRPENFCGIHFFNPVHRMPLVEIIRGEKTSEETISTAVAYALRIGKTPVVVNDCAGFLVNRLLFPYFYGFQSLMEDGVDFRKIDKTMEAFGWPMGPAYLLDVVGIDTCVHGGGVMAEAFPDRMSYQHKTAIHTLHEAGRLGQKSSSGFYNYTQDRKGKLKKVFSDDIHKILAPVIRNKKDISDNEIIERMMIPMINESARCLEEGIVKTAMEVDLGVLYGIGFPPFRGGILKYADDCGLKDIVEKSESLKDLGHAFEAAPLLKQYAKEGKNFYQMNTK
ncbi:MAG: fatty acid oxidation complex subunit alpha FadB [Deltaproteobacteria bacterium]|nr:fatty acid oxidation complex subunit alpha FadB [Deltaproteobacteria bacterium]